MVERSAREYSRKVSGIPVNILKRGNSKPIDIDFFIPLYMHLSKVHLDKDAIADRINTSKIPSGIKEINQMIYQIAKIWEEFIQTEIRKIVISNPYVKYWNDVGIDDKKIKIISMPNGSARIRNDNKEIAEFDSLLLYRDLNPIVVEIKSSTMKGSGTGWGSGYYQRKIKLARDIFQDYGEPFFLKIRATEHNTTGLTSRFMDHRKIIISSLMLADLKHNLSKKIVSTKKLEVKNDG